MAPLLFQNQKPAHPYKSVTFFSPWKNCDQIQNNIMVRVWNLSLKRLLSHFTPIQFLFSSLLQFLLYSVNKMCTIFLHKLYRPQKLGRMFVLFCFLKSHLWARVQKLKRLNSVIRKAVPPCLHHIVFVPLMNKSFYKFGFYEISLNNSNTCTRVSLS